MVQVYTALLGRCPQLLIAMWADSHGADMEGFLEEEERKEEGEQDRAMPLPLRGPPAYAHVLPVGRSHVTTPSKCT